MEKKYTGSLTLEWFNKNRSIITQKAEEKRESDVPAPRINWINKDEALFYEISEEEGKGLTPYWVDRNDIRVKESRPLVFQKAYKAVPEGGGYKVEESDVDDPEIENILIKGDNLLALNTLKKMFDQKPDDEKVKCIYIDPPFNTQNAFLSEYYDDNLAHSEWLTLIRDRIRIFRSLLSSDGLVFIHLNSEEMFHAKVMFDDIFGRENFLQVITIQAATTASFRAINLCPVNVSEYILVYSNIKETCKLNILYVESDYSEDYNTFIENRNEHYSKWNLMSLDDVFNDKNGFKNWKEAKVALGEDWKNIRYKFKTDFALKNAESVVSLNTLQKPAEYIFKIIEKSKIERDTVFCVERSGNDPIYAYNGRTLAFYRKKLRSIDNRLVPSEILTNIWKDISYLSLGLEGEVNFPNSKKPEKLLKRILELASNKNDIILDCFGGSGTTFAVAHKMKRRWIGVEIGNHANTHILTRMKSVINGEDQAGISKSINWNGGGSFKFYHLGESIISVDNEGFGDFNWNLGRDFIEKSLLATYDFILDESFSCPGFAIENPPKVGFYTVNSYTMVGIVSLSSPKENFGALDNEYIAQLIASIRKERSPQSITIFTNRGVEMAWESKPEDVEIIKVPYAIFAELER